MLITALLMAGALTAGDPDGVVATAPATAVDLGAARQPVAPSVEGATQAGVPHNLTTDEQIDRWIAARPVDAQPFERGPGESLDDGLPHGEFSVSVGTAGYRDYGAAVSLPIGETGRLDLSYRQIENGYPYGGYGYGYAPGPAYDGLAFGYGWPEYRRGAAAEFEARSARRAGRPMRRSPVRQP